MKGVYCTDIDLSWAFEVPQECPARHEKDLQPVFDGEQTAFRCPACGSCWHVEPGWVLAVDAGLCAALPPAPGRLSREAEPG